MKCSKIKSRAVYCNKIDVILRAKKKYLLHNNKLECINPSSALVRTNGGLPTTGRLLRPNVPQTTFSYIR